MPAVSKVAIAGAGIAGLAAAIPLAKAGVSVDVFEARTEVGSTSVGITLQGNALRALDSLGVLAPVEKVGYSFEGFTIRAPGPEAAIVAQTKDARPGGAKYPKSCGILRGDLERILLTRATKLGANVHLGAPVTEAVPGRLQVQLGVGGAHRGAYDLLIGADGLTSTVRRLVGIETRPQPLGAAIWRAVVARPAEVTGMEIYYGGPALIAGYAPCGPDQLYVFLVEKAQDRSGVTADEAIRIMLAASEGYGGPWEAIRSELWAKGANVHYTQFSHHLVPAPWNRDRVVLIGDAAHSFPPTLAQGGAQSLEDAVVLGELLAKGKKLDDTLWDAFHARRLPRVTAVLDASVEIANWQIASNRDTDTAGRTAAIATLLAEAV